ncbi:hypothetical protein GF412_02510 [Candidatus Micrarchaeota archaeon]|nr:hypothetical protein [Candidatus Micrarchaeota archaeon]MBD3417831.1 hypothetical protein [Candidatus Micrarchaeota archaeon]
MRGLIFILLAFGLFLGGCTGQPLAEPSEWDVIEPPPQLQQCTDSDGGKDEFISGTASVGEESGTDRCLGEDEMVLEYYCDGNEIADENMQCPAGYLCYGGACVESTCYDSDGGKDTSKTGTVSYGNEEYTDSCIDGETVKEYYCGEGALHEEIGCGPAEECINGRCVGVAQCSDSDGGINEFIKGTATYGSATYADSCLSYNVVYEYYCKGGELAHEQVVCPEGMDCENGYCVEGPERECRETDGGKDRYEEGTITYWVGDTQYSETDKCYDQDSVLETWCTEEGGKGFGIIECDSDEWCEDGECVSG